MEEINVLHYDYQFSSWMYKEDISEAITPEMNINYRFYEKHGRLDYIDKEIRAVLHNMDVFLVHPGVKGQSLILPYKKDFPNLKIGLVSTTKEHYTEDQGIAIVSYENIEGIVNFMLSARR